MISTSRILKPLGRAAAVLAASAGLQAAAAQGSLPPGPVIPPAPQQPVEQGEPLGPLTEGYAGLYTERFRPQYHYSPPFGWMNDPNGMVYYQDQYHLFYQYNPYAVTFGSIGWGHAVSDDLLQWQPLPIALPPEEDVLIFSGSVVVDENNTSGLCDMSDEAPGCLVAIYTANRTTPTGVVQTQDLAYSNDSGRTWTKYEGNPVLDRGLADFRDPKVFWHPETQRWVMAVALPLERKVQFFTSPNLRDWNATGEFGPAGAVGGIWECPDLLQVPVEGKPGERRWVLKVDLNPGHVAGGSGGQYFIGEFDGSDFELAQPTSQDEVLWLDYGKDFYCAHRWYETPAGGPDPVSGEAPVWIGWLNDWLYATELPTYPWRGSMTLPRSLSVRELPEGARLFQHPIDTLPELRGQPVRAQGSDVGSLNAQFSQLQQEGLQSFEMIIRVRPGESEEVGLALHTATGAEPAARIGYDSRRQRMFVQRPDGGNVEVAPTFPGLFVGPLPLENGEARLHLLVDRNSIELFGNDGRTVITSLMFPEAPITNLEFYGGPAESIEVEYWPLRSAWKPADARAQQP